MKNPASIIQRLSGPSLQKVASLPRGGPRPTMPKARWPAPAWNRASPAWRLRELQTDRPTNLTLG